ncbi:DNA methyltransferase [Myxococcus qinghaiensis]|uniref:DNA methyltransferase n=1 Tax=Myxococcus qinghaiensis TaxID=2906758 RepID=UPI0020A737EE|nr:DNA methyltransferase [Myxococcus qinghaiensis]MCP3161806.1 hypothetical protein [Myxococcus qinghaiensis]
MGEKKHAFHSMCSYLGCFPPRVPRQALQALTRRGDLVLDPFCGSGTSLVEALLLERPCVGVDLNPLAVTLARAKTQPVEARDVLTRLRELASEYPGGADMESVPEAVHTFFHPRTLAQLVYVKEQLGDSPEDLFLRGALLGIMHGKFRKGGGTAYLSIDMPNTFSMSVGYVQKFVRKHGLKQPPVDVFHQLRERVVWLFRGGPIPESPRATILQGNATSLPVLLETARISQVDAVVTSPPYLGVLRYGAFNWLRLWFLGFEPIAVDRALDGTDSLDRYLSFMTSFLLSAGQVVKPSGAVALVIGDVVEYGNHLPLAERVWEEVSGVVPFDLVRIDQDNFDEKSKTTRIWGEEKKGRATPLDRVLILRRRAQRKVSSRLGSTGADSRKAKAG